jgi:hypothetical protein
MSPTAANAATAIGFLTVLQEAGGYVGGYLVTNNWGRPLEFRLSSAVQPNKVQQILYAGTLVPYICADLIGKTLVDKAGVAVQLVVTDREAVLDLRLKAETPVLYLAPPEEEPSSGPNVVRPGQPGKGPLLCHPRYPADVATANEMLERLEGALDLAEPFARIREAVAEARKMGVGGR